VACPSRMVAVDRLAPAATADHVIAMRSRKADWFAPCAADAALRRDDPGGPGNP
jgi:hypothetical protein